MFFPPNLPPCRVKSDMDEANNTLIGAHGYCMYSGEIETLYAIGRHFSSIYVSSSEIFCVCIQLSYVQLMYSCAINPPLERVMCLLVDI